MSECKSLLKLNQEDNDVIIQHIYKWNIDMQVDKKMAIDVYIDSIEFLDDDIIFHSKRIKPILDEDYNITKDNVGSSKGEIGDSVKVPLSQFEKPYDGILYAAVREIKLNKLYEK